MNRTELLASMRVEIRDAHIADLPVIIGQLETLRAEAFARLFTTAVASSTRPEPGTSDGEDRLLNVDETATMLGVKPGWVFRHQAELPRVSLPGRAVRFSAKRLAAFIKRRSYA